MLQTGYNSSVISIRRYSVGEHRESLWDPEFPKAFGNSGLWFHIVPLFFIELLAVSVLPAFNQRLSLLFYAHFLLVQIKVVHFLIDSPACYDKRHLL